MNEMAVNKHMQQHISSLRLKFDRKGEKSGKVADVGSARLRCTLDEEGGGRLFPPPPPARYIN